MGYRNEENCIAGFNLVILDVDNGTPIEVAKELLKQYKVLYYTTKRHTEEVNRYRIIMPLSHIVKLNRSEYKKFMINIYNWLPFEVDTQTNQRSRKWESFNGTYHYSEGELLDAMLFIPETKKQEEQHKKVLDNSSLNNLERWFLFNTNEGNRNNQVFKYAMVLVDSEYSYENIKSSVSNFNNSLAFPLTDEELEATVMVSVINKLQKRGNP